jgi:hypothetical protein
MAQPNDLVPIADLSPWPAQQGATRAYHAMVKPVGSICNIDCTCCYQLHKKELLGSESKFQITDQIFETHIKQYIEGQDREEVVFSWQGESQGCWGWSSSTKWWTWSRSTGNQPAH